MDNTVKRQLTGVVYNDQICLNAIDSNLCVSRFDFFSITNRTGTGDYDGVIGLAHNLFGDIEKSIINSLYVESQIPARQVSFWLNADPSFANIVTIGGQLD